LRAITSESDIADEVTGGVADTAGGAADSLTPRFNDGTPEHNTLSP
jgi:hypothetical protein